MSLSLQPANIPADLRALDAWVCWRYEAQDEPLKLTKVPYSARTGHAASSTNAATWAGLADALDGLTRWQMDGIGFVLSTADPFAGIDLDHCIDPATGAIALPARLILGELCSYSEVSPSGTGIRVICRGTLPEGRRKKANYEMYDTGRFLTMTGHVLPGLPCAVLERTAALARVHARLWPPAPQTARTARSDPSLPPLTDSDIQMRARAARNGGKFAALWAGDISGYHSRSEAHAALCAILAFWTQDREQIDRLMRQSGLYPNAKWDRADYRRRTLDLALSGA